MALWIVAVTWITKLVLLGLVGMSLYSLAMILKKNAALKVMDDPSSGVRKEFTDKLAAFKGSSEQVEHLTRGFLIDARTNMETGLTTLTTLGANAPYVGLFGTVLGIIQSFGILARNDQGASSMIMASIAEALIATAIGLFVAIPAVVAVNGFSRRIKTILADCEAFKENYLGNR